MTKIENRLITIKKSKIEMEFHLAVDEHLKFCHEVGKKPEKEQYRELMIEKYIE